MPKGAKLNTNDLSTKRRRGKKKKTRLYGVFAVLCIAGMVGIVRANFFRLQYIEVVGAESVPSGKIKDIAEKELAGEFLYIVPKNNVLFYPQEQIAALIVSEFPELASVKLNSGFDNKLYIEIEEKVQNALWCSKNNECYAMDYSGFIFEKVSSEQVAGTLVFRGLIQDDPIGKRFGKEGDLGVYSRFAQELGGLGFAVKRINIIDSLSAEAWTDTGTRIFFVPSEADDPELLGYIKAFIDNMKKQQGSVPTFEYLDARYGNKIFYKLQ